jgi:hypothetical protein
MTTSADGPTSAPVLVTGMHRSGTTWLAHMLCGGRDFIRIGEPLSVSNRQTVLPARVEHWYTYITAENEDEYVRWFSDAQRFRLHPLADIKRARLGSPRDPFRVAGRWGSFLLGRAQRRRLIVHDPFAVFSATWFARRLGYRVLVTVRHPLAVVSSLKRLNWAFDFRHLLEQPALMSERLEPYRRDMEAAARSSDIVEQGSLLWRMVYETLTPDRPADPSVTVVRHEDLSIDPTGEFARLYAGLHLSYGARARSTIEQATSSANPKQQRLDDPDAVRLDSRANLENWRHRLDATEVERIVERTSDVVERFYPAHELPGELATRDSSRG